MFELKHVSKAYGGEPALRDVSMVVGKGLNFIIGASGSGKTTLLKIISGMEQDFEGDVFYCGQSMKTLSAQERGYFYNNIFGFVWQDFNLLDDLTVLENVMLPQYLKQGVDEKAARRILRELKISELAGQKAGKLSGGQKQRVAIARELMKNPKVILADEPTSALDEKASQTTISILRELAKSRTVIVVTHDTTLIDPKSKVYELDKGALMVPAEETHVKPGAVDTSQVHKLSFSRACKLAVQNAKSKWRRFDASLLSLLVAAALLLVTVSGTILDNGQAAFDELFDTYGSSILDLSLVGSFISAGGTDGKQSEAPTANVSQDIDGLYERYRDDPRVSHIVFSQAYNDIQITADHKVYKIDSSGSVPAVNELTAGVMPMGSGNEVAVPQSFVEKMGLADQEALGRSIDFSGAVYNWDSGQPVSMPVGITAQIVGVVDTTVRYESGGRLEEYTIDDSFFFSKPALDAMRAQAGIKNSVANFTIRTKTPADLIAMKDKLNADGIVPLGRFELVEDMVRLNEQTSSQSGSAIAVIGLLSIVVVLAVSVMTALTRKREYAIYRISGYGTGQLALLTAAEYLLASAASALVFLCASPLINLATAAFWNVSILSGRLLGTGVLLVFVMGALSGGVTALVSVTTKASISLKTGDR